LVAIDQEIGADDPEPPDMGAWKRRLEVLTPTMRKAVVLRHVVGLAYADIAVALDRPEGTVKADVHRGLERLRRQMEMET
jgi:DNA-directed RNA polymerase specialized sigma24 family protein